MTLSLTNASKLDDIVCTIKLTLHHPDPQQLHLPFDSLSSILVILTMGF
jgi:hypothetical protein